MTYQAIISNHPRSRNHSPIHVVLHVLCQELEASVLKSGTLDLVLPFINSTRPSIFAQSDITHKQGRDKIWLKHLIPLLFSRRPEPQALAAFHFAMEAIIKAEQGRSEVSAVSLSLALGIRKVLFRLSYCGAIMLTFCLGFNLEIELKPLICGFGDEIY